MVVCECPHGRGRGVRAGGPLGVRADGLRDPQPQVLRVIEVVGLHRLPGVAVEDSTDLAEDSPRVLA
jgi:hypothetical protein